MFFGFMLVCSVETCEPVWPTNLFGSEQECQVDLLLNGIPWVLNNMPNTDVVDLQCIQVGEPV